MNVESYRIGAPAQDRRNALKRLLVLPAIAAGIGGSGCVSSADTTPAPGAAPAAGRATFIFSVSHERGVPPKDVSHLVDLRVIGNGPSIGDAVFSSFDSFSPAEKSTLGDAYGQVYVKEVAPGRYAFVEWYLSDDTNVLFPTRWRPRSAPPALQFDARADEVIYLGNLHGHIVWRPLLSGLVPTPAGVTVEVRDRAGVDLPVAIAKYPPLRDRVTMALVPLGTWGGS